MGRSLDKLTIKGFKSIQSLENFELKNLNILIGGNGAGKSNFIDFFRMLRAMLELSVPGLERSCLQKFFTKFGKFPNFLFNGPKTTPQIEVTMLFGDNGYKFKLSATPPPEETAMISEEAWHYRHAHHDWWNASGDGMKPALLAEKDKPGIVGAHNVPHYVFEAISSWSVYHFHDTSSSAPMRRREIVQDNRYLRFDAANIAPYLLGLRERSPDAYQEIVNSIRLVTPFFDDFLLTPNQSGAAKEVCLDWHQRGSDYPMQPYHLSDGTLRFICLATALLQPNPPSTLIIDEPELGLHPQAIDILAELIEAAARTSQVIVSTQSPLLIDFFAAEDVVIVNRKDGASTFERLDSKDLTCWLEDYSLGELWRKNVVVGGPVHE